MEDEDDSREEILFNVKSWSLSYVWGLGEASVDSSIIPEHMRHGPQFLNALDLKIVGSTRLEFEDTGATIDIRIKKATFNAKKGEAPIGGCISGGGAGIA